MPKKTKPVEDEKVEERNEIPVEDSASWVPPMEGTTPKAAFGHVIGAAMEFMGAMEGMMPKGKMPEEARVHYLAAKKEMMLMARAMLDAKIAACEAEAAGAEGPRIKKINLD